MGQMNSGMKAIAPLVEMELDRVLATPEFVNAERSSRFLRFVVEAALEGRMDSLKESVVGVQVFDREIGFDPKLDPIVRVTAGRIRERLDRYYESPHPETTVRILLPKGRYIPEFVPFAPSEQAADFKTPSLVTEAPEIAPEPAPTVAPPRKWQVPALAGALLILAGVWWYAAAPPPPRHFDGPVSEFTIELPADQEIVGSWGRNLTLSPDGTILVYAARQDDTFKLFVRRLDGSEIQSIPGSDGAYSPFFSPDGKWIAAYTNGSLRRFSIEGKSQDLAPLGPGFTLPGGVWDARAGLLFNASPEKYKQVTQSLVYRMPDPAGQARTTATPVNPANPPESYMIQQVLPGGSHYLVSARSSPPHHRSLSAFSAADGSRKYLVEDATGGFYAPTGHLVFWRDGALMAAPLDLSRMQLTGPPAGVRQKVALAGWQGADSAISSTGTLAYISGTVTIPDRRMVWVDMNGKESPLPIPPGPFNPLDISQDGRKLLLAKFDPMSQTWSLWSYDLVANASLRIGGPSPDVIVGCWSPDGKEVVFGSKQHNFALGEILRKDSSGAGAEKRVVSQDYFGDFPQTWSTDGRWIAYVLGTKPETKGDIWIADVRSPGQAAPREFVANPGWDTTPAFSPDGKWLAYASDTAGRREVFVQAFPGGGKPLQVTSGGGLGPLWAPDGRALYYQRGRGIYRVGFAAGEEPRLGTPELLFQGSWMSPGLWQRSVLLAPDGKRFLMAYEDLEMTRRQIHVVVNWFADLTRTMMGGK